MMVMEAKPATLIKFLDSSQQFSIPIYQRSYSWTEHQCSQLWDDIVRVALDKKILAHFIGSIVYIEKNIYQASDITKLQVIDGQQRLTTILLLLAALGRALKKDSAKYEITQEKIENRYIFNIDELNAGRYKLILRRSDNEAFKKILDGKDIPEDQSTNIVHNFNFFQDKIKSNEINIDLLYAGIKKLIIIDVSLESGKDNPQLIFESLNSTGLDLSQADLIRNYILMGLEEKKQEDLYREYWQPIEEAFDHAENSNYFDRFMRDYLTIKTRQIPNMDEVYQEFKKYYRSVDSVDNIIHEIHYYAMNFTKLAFEQEPNPQLNEVIHNINTLKVNVAYPFLLEVYVDRDEKKISNEIMLEIFTMVESYVFRRAICGIPTNSLNKTFGYLSGELDKNNYLQSLKAILYLKESYKRFPTDVEFEEGFLSKDVYRTSHLRKHLLDRLENHNRKEKVNINDYTIEHIMPRNLTKEWKNTLGENWEMIHEKYLHTAGNLTLTGYNPELGNKSFLEKRDMKGGFANSPLTLNTSLAKLEQWGQDEILERGKFLAEKSIKIWKRPPISQEILDKYGKKDEDVDTEDDDDEDAPDLRWESNLTRASAQVKQNINKLLLQINQKFDCNHEPYSWWLKFYVKTSNEPETMFALLGCGRNTANVMFRIDPNTFKPSKNTRKVAGWFFPTGTERRIKLTADTISEIMDNLDHAHSATLRALDV